MRGDDWKYLEWTKKEVNEIDEVLSKNGVATTKYQGKAATEEVFKTLGTDKPSPRILHLATHGYFFPEPDDGQTRGFSSSANPFIRSGLILADGNLAWQGKAIEDGKEDGILTAYEIAQMNLKGTELVVLSACETGLGELTESGAVEGLRQAFKLAGAKYILMSLWSVNDKKTYEFMTLFYDFWQNQAKEIPEAYRLAQNTMRQRYLLPFNPNAWAGFVLVE